MMTSRRVTTLGMFLGIFAGAGSGYSQQTVQSGKSATVGAKISEEQEKSEQHERFGHFIGSIAGEELNAQRDTNEGKDTVHDIYPFWKIVKITQNEERIIRIILMQGYERWAALDKAYSVAVASHDRNEVKIKSDAVTSGRLVIEDDVIAQIEAQVGSEDFKKINAYLITIFPPPRNIVVASPKNGCLAATKSCFATGGALQ